MVCNEHRELFSLITFLKTVKDPEDDINILVDSRHVSPQVRQVLEQFKDDTVQNDRDFTGDFSEQRNYHLTTCTGEYIFVLDPDEMPQEALIRNIKNAITDSGGDIFLVPRINIHPGSTQTWLDTYGFIVNEFGWINWPDYQFRIFKNTEEIRYVDKLHERPQGFKNPVNFDPDPRIALWHIKSVEKQNSRWDTNGPEPLYKCISTGVVYQNN